MIDQKDIAPGMDVVDTKGQRVGAVAQCRDDMIALSPADFADGLHHFLPIAAVRGVHDGKLVVEPGEASTIEAVTGAADYGRANAAGTGGDSLFGTSGHGTGFGGSGTGH